MRVINRQTFINSAAEDYVTNIGRAGLDGAEVLPMIKKLIGIGQLPEAKQDALLDAARLEMPFECCECGKTVSQIIQLGGDVRLNKVEICPLCLEAASRMWRKHNESC